MLAGGMVIAAPSMVPQAAAAEATLYVSAVNPTFDNTFGGAQIIEVIVDDPGSKGTDEVQFEPLVKVNDLTLRMVQTTQGSWYGFFGSYDAVKAADDADNNLDFGTEFNLSDAASTPTINDGEFDATSVYIDAGNGGVLGKALGESDINSGQIAIDPAQWPFIQLYDLPSSTFTVEYFQSEIDPIEINYLSADLDDYASIALDRNEASQGSEVHLSITDNQLNIDPTAEDVVMFNVALGEYVSFTDGTDTSPDAFKPYNNGFDENGKLLIDYNAQDVANDVLENTATDDDPTADNILVFYESGEQWYLYQY
jgi:hypothetical protein